MSSSKASVSVASDTRLPLEVILTQSTSFSAAFFPRVLLFSENEQTNIHTVRCASQVACFWSLERRDSTGNEEAVVRDSRNIGFDAQTQFSGDSQSFKADAQRHVTWHTPFDRSFCARRLLRNERRRFGRRLLPRRGAVCRQV